LVSSSESFRQLSFTNADTVRVLNFVTWKWQKNYKMVTSSWFFGNQFINLVNCQIVASDDQNYKLVTTCFFFSWCDISVQSCGHATVYSNAHAAPPAWIVRALGCNPNTCKSCSDLLFLQTSQNMMELMKI